MHCWGFSYLSCPSVKSLDYQCYVNLRASRLPLEVGEFIASDDMSLEAVAVLRN